MRDLPVTLMRGGTSRGPVVEADRLPDDEARRDELLLEVVGRGRAQLDGVGGGSPTTSKAVVVSRAVDDPGVDIHYRVGNVAVGEDVIDFAGTCGNMTATVALYALEHGWAGRPGAVGTYTLRNLATGACIESTVAAAHAHTRGDAARVVARYLDPSGSVFPTALPTGHPRDDVRVDGHRFDVSVVDVTHPYLFADEQDVAAAAAASRRTVEDLVEAIRADVCVRLGTVSDPADAARLSAAVPRAVLIHGMRDDGTLEIVALSMGEIIPTAPVTAAMCATAAAVLPGTILQSRCATAPTKVAAAASEVTVTASLSPDRRLEWVEVERTARTIVDGTVWTA